MKYSNEQLKDFARKVIEECASDPDYMGVGEQFEETWADLTPDEFDDVQSRVHDLACNAIVTVSWPDEQDGDDR